MAKKQSKPSAPLIASEDGLAAAVNRYVDLALQLEQRKTRLAQQIVALNKNFEDETKELVAEIDGLVGSAHLFLDRNRQLFPGDAKSLVYRNAIVGFRTNPPKVDKVLPKDTWDAIVERVSAAAWGADYIKEKDPTLDKEAILAHRADLTEEQLRSVGIEITQGETFFIDPAGESAPAIAIAKAA